MLQQKNQNDVQRANERGVVAARRPISGEDQMVLRGIFDILESELPRAGHLTKLRRFGVTAVGFGRFDEYHREFGPSTKEIVEQVESTYHPIDEVWLGRIGIYGTDSIRKLGISIMNDRLPLEKSEIEAAFGDKGFPLLQGPHRKEGYAQHVSIALLDNNSEYFRDPEVIESLESSTGLGVDSTLSISLRPVSAHGLA